MELTWQLDFDLIPGARKSLKLEVVDAAQMLMTDQDENIRQMQH